MIHCKGKVDCKLWMPKYGTFCDKTTADLKEDKGKARYLKSNNKLYNTTFQQ